MITKIYHQGSFNDELWSNTILYSYICVTGDIFSSFKQLFSTFCMHFNKQILA